LGRHVKPALVKVKNGDLCVCVTRKSLKNTCKLEYINLTINKYVSKHVKTNVSIT